MIWTNESLKELIEMFHKAPALWNMRSKDYKDKNKRSEEIRKIANHFKVTEEEISKKIISLKSQFRRERRKKLTSEKSGAAAMSSTKEWFAYSYLKFLAENEESNGSRNTMMVVADESDLIPSFEEGETSVDTENEMNNTENYGGDMDSFWELIKKKNKEEDEKMTLKRKQNESDESRLEEAYTFLQSVKKEMLTKDIYSIYGENVAIRMRNAGKSNFATAVARNKIDNILFALEMGYFDKK